MYPVNRHGAFGHGISPSSVNIFEAKLNQCLGDRLSPYRVFRRRRYVRGGVSGQLTGGLIMYCSFFGSVDWQNAF